MDGGGKPSDVDDSIISLPRFSYPPPEFEQVNFPNLLQKNPCTNFFLSYLNPLLLKQFLGAVAAYHDLQRPC